MRTGILWDLDGTLLDTLEGLAISTNAALALFGCAPRTLDEVRAFVGNGAGELIRRALPGRPGDPERAAVLEAFQVHYRAHCQEHSTPYGGIPEALAELGKTYPMAIVSNKPDPAAKALCARYFPGVPAWGEAAGCRRKPAPDMVFRAMKELGVERCVYVGDSEVDVMTAKAANVPCLSVLWGFRDQKTLENAGAAHYCRRPEELPGLIRTLWPCQT